jgi:uncharacterized protein (DUF2236 family)
VAAILPAPGDWPALAPGPATITWRRAGDARLLLAAGYALLLQVSHPTVGAGVSEHSRFRSDPWGRLLRTLDYSYTMVYGGPDRAGEMGRRIRAYHKQISGTTPDGRRYHALEPEAYAWVHATLAEAIVTGHARFGRPFTDIQRQCFWEEWRSVGRLLGVRERDLPGGWPEFCDYFKQIVHSVLCHTPAVDDVLAALGAPAPPAVAGLYGAGWAFARVPLGHVLELTTIGLLPPALRRRFGVGWTWRMELELRALCATLRASTPVAPSWLRNTGPDYLRWRREALARGEVASGVLPDPSRALSAAGAGAPAHAAAPAHVPAPAQAGGPAQVAAPASSPADSAAAT